jgi:hypothetical protein
MSSESSPAPALENTGDSQESSGQAAPEAGGSKPVGRYAPDRLLALLALVVLLASVFGPIAAAGIWEPYELNVAELSRRIAVQLFGAESLRIEGSNNAVPIVSDLGKGELPFTVVALAFKAAGLKIWVGRAALGVFGVLGAWSLYVLISRFSSRRGAAYSVIALATMPLFFLQARTLLGDIVAMAALTTACTSLMLLCYGSWLERPLGHRGRLVAGVTALLAIWAGFYSRGLLIGVTIPLLGVGLTGRLLHPHLKRQESSGATSRRFGDVANLVCLLLGSVSLGFAVYFLWRQSEPGARYSFWLGTTAQELRMLPTHDALIRQLGHGLFPWSALLPFAVGRVLSQGELGRTPGETIVRVGLVVVSGTAFVLYGAQTSLTGVLPFAAVPLLAGVVGIALSDLERGARFSRMFALGVVAFAVVLSRDFVNLPEELFTAFSVDDVELPEGLAAKTHLVFGLVALACFALFGCAVAEAGDGPVPHFERDEYLAWPRALRSAFAGNLWFGVVAVEVGLVMLWLSKVLSDRYWKLLAFESLGREQRVILSWGWLVFPLAVALLPALALLVRDVFRLLYERLLARRFGVPARVSRAAAAVASLAAFGLVLSLSYYPALAAELSPQEAILGYRSHAKRGEPLAMLGISAGAARYSAGADVQIFTAPSTAVDWLLASESRRWLVVRERDLARLNASFRTKTKPPRNIPLLDAESSAVYLASNRLLAGEKDVNELDSVIVAERPRPAHPLDVELRGKLQVLGWEVRDTSGRTVETINAGKPYEFLIFYEVGAALSGDWETFIHIDGYQRRHNGDHPTLGGRYPMSLWRRGDFLVDRYEFSLPSYFSSGTYAVFFGLFKGEKRLSVERGRHEQDRIVAGKVEVR